ncbi:hypothetical protein HY479_02060 [Candidatus Uhrbacteria bacterium]|nr:hypothetical protein [Candidatus Uhrbacteria bacterium]
MSEPKNEPEAEWPEREPSPFPLRRLIPLLIVIVSLVDSYEILTGTVDLNKHIPFLYPVVLTVIYRMLVLTERITRRMRPMERTRVLLRTRRDSFTNPRNLPASRAENDIG